MRSAAYLDDYYARTSRRYNTIRLDQDADIKATLAVLPTQPGIGDCVLDVGGGTARYSAPFLERDAKVVVLDRSWPQLSNCHGDVAKICGLAETLPFRGDTFSASLMIMMIHQMESDQQMRAFSEVFRVLRPGGCLLIKTCSRQDLRRRPFDDYFPSAARINEARYPRIPEVVLTLSAIGYSDIRRRGVTSSRLAACDDIIRSVIGRHSTTLALVPEAEFRAGTTSLRRDLIGRSTVEVHQFHTVILGYKAAADQTNKDLK